MSNIAFPGTAESRAAYISELTGTIDSRAAHLRELSLHMRALELANASLTEVEEEVVELETAVAVYRRFAGAPANGANRSNQATAAAGNAVAATDGDARESDTAPTFSQFALTHLGTPDGEAADDVQATQTASQDDNGTRPSWLAPRSGRGV